MEHSIDRRQHPRTAITRQAKLFHRGTWSYIACQTIDASPKGLLLEVKGNSPLAVGDIVDAAVGWEHQPLLRAEEFISAKIVRLDTTSDGRQLAAVALTREVIGLTQFIQAA